MPAGDKKAQALASYLAVHVKVLQEDRKAIENLPKSLREVAALYGEVGDKREQEDVMKDILEFHLANGQREEAAKVEQEIRDQVKGNKTEEPPCLLRLAAVFYSMSAMEGARTLVEEAVAGFGASGDKAGSVTALRSMAMLYLSQQKFDEALQALEKAVQGTGTEKASIQYGISQVYAAMGGKGVSSAVDALKKARAFMKEDGNKALMPLGLLAGSPTGAAAVPLCPEAKPEPRCAVQNTPCVIFKFLSDDLQVEVVSKDGQLEVLQIMSELMLSKQQAESQDSQCNAERFEVVKL
ncbi:unnamed protein product [Symbiodinium necroappetens]|uniref:Uncharacterized protein n=1 Tax=Symbiodinium necroappetens TaxID=1628268 RepID=A0A812YYD0_9DINO|nr:unnamed protein product [Symbiodinium necroappetens]